MTKENIDLILKEHEVRGGNAINDSLGKLFTSLDDEENKNEVEIKVAALNKIYSTAILYIAPVVDKIHSTICNDHEKFTLDDYVKTVDEISNISWVSPTTQKTHQRVNLSFSSKYIHFLSNRQIPIYDSYIWIVMVGYIRSKNYKVSFSAPKTYQEFYDVFINFKGLFDLEDYSNYDLDKYLWQYGKNLITNITEADKVSLSKAKSILKSGL